MTPNWRKSPNITPNRKSNHHEPFILEGLPRRTVPRHPLQNQKGPLPRPRRPEEELAHCGSTSSGWSRPDQKPVSAAPTLHGPRLRQDRKPRSVRTKSAAFGDYFGPVVVVLRVRPQGTESKDLLKLGVKDSKKLSDEQIREIAPTLKRELLYQAVVLPNPKHNEMIAKGFNLNKIKSYLAQPCDPQDAPNRERTLRPHRRRPVHAQRQAFRVPGGLRERRPKHHLRGTGRKHPRRRRRRVDPRPRRLSHRAWRNWTRKLKSDASQGAHPRSSIGIGKRVVLEHGGEAILEQIAKVHLQKHRTDSLASHAEAPLKRAFLFVLERRD
ncbi:MAG: hypothetical protein MZU79_05785 [Anaerotruncus sp.]|nr:hypothetical protein [Anaerotruncus sp.]